MFKLKVGDKIKVTLGKDKGREGEVEKVFPSDAKVLVPGLNIYKKHVKGFQAQKVGIYEVPRPLTLSKIALVCPKCKKPTRVGFKEVAGNKERVCRKCGKSIDTNTKKK